MYNHDVLCILMTTLKVLCIFVSAAKQTLGNFVSTEENLKNTGEQLIFCLNEFISLALGCTKFWLLQFLRNFLTSCGSTTNSINPQNFLVKFLFYASSEHFSMAMHQKSKNGHNSATALC